MTRFSGKNEDTGSFVLFLNLCSSSLYPNPNPIHFWWLRGTPTMRKWIQRVLTSSQRQTRTGDWKKVSVQTNRDFTFYSYLWEIWADVNTQQIQKYNPWVRDSNDRKESGKIFPTLTSCLHPGRAPKLYEFGFKSSPRTKIVSQGSKVLDKAWKAKLISASKTLWL